MKKEEKIIDNPSITGIIDAYNRTGVMMSHQIIEEIIMTMSHARIFISSKLY